MSIKFGIRTYTTNAKACRSLLKLQKTKLFHLYYMHYCMTKFRTKKKKKISYINIPKISIYLSIFISFTLIPHNSDFAS